MIADKRILSDSLMPPGCTSSAAAKGVSIANPKVPESISLHEGWGGYVLLLLLPSDPVDEKLQAG